VLELEGEDANLSNQLELLGARVELRRSRGCWCRVGRLRWRLGVSAEQAEQTHACGIEGSRAYVRACIARWEGACLPALELVASERAGLRGSERLSRGAERGAVCIRR